MKILVLAAALTAVAIVSPASVAADWTPRAPSR